MILKAARSILILTVLSLNLIATAQAKIQHIRLEQPAAMTNDLAPLLAKLAQQPGIPALKAADFLEVENRVLATYRFSTRLQLFQGVPIAGAMIRTWSDLTSGQLILVDAHIDDGQLQAARLQALRSHMSGSRSLNQTLINFNSRPLAQKIVSRHPTDSQMGRLVSADQWNGADLERVIKISAKRGQHTLVYSHFLKRMKSKEYREYPQDDPAAGTIELPAMVFPIYEESESDIAAHTVEARIPVMLRNVLTTRKDVSSDPYSSLKTHTYLYSMLDDVKAATVEGQNQGYWSLSGLKSLMALIQSKLPTIPNTFDTGGMYLQGKYATINLHPEVTQFKGVNIPLTMSDRLVFDWADAAGGDYELKFGSPFKGKILTDMQSALNRPARRLPDHDPASYINDGFDEVQVYYAINTLVESLQKMGFTDPELSTRPFNAFLFNPDIEMKDNAFYTDDTINFTTYSGDQNNAARDNSTIWHELGHGIMDRLMGDRIVLADTGGLSEGMADFVAQLIIYDVTNGVPFNGSDTFRIVNQTGFYLTNEAHDDGEAYGGSMRDILVLAFAKEGHQGLVKLADLTMDAMRLARNHPALTANDWFESILFADKLGHAGFRAPGEMHDLVVQALNHRNFRFDKGTPAQLVVKTAEGELNAKDVGSRYNPYIHRLKSGESASHDVEVSIASSDTYKFVYPVTVEVIYNGWALQGAVKWNNEAAGAQKIILKGPADTAKFNFTALSSCDFINRADGACQDYAYIRIYNNGEDKPVAKKRFYVRVYPNQP